MSDDAKQDGSKQKGKKQLLAIVRWVVAIIGLIIVVWNMSLRDGVLLLDPATNAVTPTVLAHHAEEDALQFDVVDPETRKVITVDRARLVNPRR